MSEEQITPQETTANAPTSSVFRSVAIFILVIVVAGAGFYFRGKSAGAVAVVNGESISREQYDARHAQVIKNVVAQGLSATSTEVIEGVKSQVLDNLISEMLLLQAAKKEGLTANDASITEQVAKEKLQFKDEKAYNDALKDEGFTDASYKMLLTKGNIIQQYLATHMDARTIVATDAEVKQFYTESTAGGQVIPPLKEVYDIIKNQIIQKKTRQLIIEHIQNLKASSTVEIKI